MVSTTLLKAPTVTDPSHTQAILKEAPKFLQSQQSGITLPYPLSLLVNSESQEKWASYENILVASLETGDYDLAQQCVEALVQRFGKLNERVLILRGMYDEAVAKDEKELGAILKQYDEVIKEAPTMFGLRKRRVALLKSLGRTNDAVTSLVDILDNSPTDVEAWAELADLYISQGSLERAVFCLEEVLLITPNAWNMHAKLGEVLYLSASTAQGLEQAKVLDESIRRFCRSAELCSTYLRAFYGMKVSTTQLIALTSQQTDNTTKNQADKVVLSLTKLQKLNELATSKLAEITRNSRSGGSGWDGYDSTELTAAQSLIDKADGRQVR